MNFPLSPFPRNAVFHPHDLLWVRSPEAFHLFLPGWATGSWPVVVRRAETNRPGLVAVGLRGRTRSERQANLVAAADVVRSVTPEALARHVADICSVETLAPLVALRTLAPWLDDLGLPWGPAGSAGFTLATGKCMLGAESDLDLVVRAIRTPSEAQIEGLRALQGRVACRLDVQIDTGRGGFALNEWLAGPRQVLLKTARGPVLVRDPWQLVDAQGVAA
ncbi:malonate decarboxylase holo-ACP synthase [Aromatoleum sp.]|uniref:malonate decarboxylase holo-ACP synthase n=1 Tax=Aromatoleum sp. TaxID=2307007 RepID=UPI002FC938B6